MISIIAFILIIGVLVLVHEYGHFQVAKWLGMRVDTFAIGFPPTVKKWSRKETVYKLNAIPFGGYVSIHGETGSDEPLEDADRALSRRHPIQQIAVFIAGVVMNILFAWLLFIILAGLYPFAESVPADEYNQGLHPDATLDVVYVVEDSPASQAGIEVKDNILEIAGIEGPADTTPTPDEINQIVDTEQSITITFQKSESESIETASIQATIEEETNDPQIGLAMGLYVTPQSQNIFEIIGSGTQQMIVFTERFAYQVYDLIFQTSPESPSFDELSGPVGIVQISGQAVQSGFDSVLFLTAMLSINLAILNILPVPALDGGRILFAIIEMISRKKINKKWYAIANITGFALLMILMIVVTVKDVITLL